MRILHTDDMTREELKEWESLSNEEKKNLARQADALASCAYRNAMYHMGQQRWAIKNLKNGLSDLAPLPLRTIKKENKDESNIVA